VSGKAPSPTGTTVKTYPIPASLRQSAHVTPDAYETIYRQSIESPERFWDEMGRAFLQWEAPWNQVLACDFINANIKWFVDGKLNVSVNCLDRHLVDRGDKVALIWEGNEPGERDRFTFTQLHKAVCQAASMLRRLGVKKGDRVAIYLPMIPEAVICMLACTRIGAIHSVVFAGFSAEALQDRINDCLCSILITANEALRGPKSVPLKSIVDTALVGCASIRNVLVVKRTLTDVPMKEGRDLWYTDELAKTITDNSAPEVMDSEDPLFVLYTSGSTGKPKGVLHTTGGYLLYAAITHKFVFDVRDNDVFFCTADIGWITGHSYIVYGPLANGTTTVLFESTPVHPTPSRLWQVVEQNQVTIFYTAPTAIRALAKEGDEYVRRHDRSSLRVLGSVGEPINRDAWLWYYNVVGEERCAVVDTWWQTETGGILIAPLPGAVATKPGSATRPLFGIEPAILNEEHQEITAAGQSGDLCIKRPWPGMMRTVFGDHERFRKTYFSQHPGYYFTGDGCHRDEDNYLWITGRVDDVLNVAGHRIGTAEVESAIARSGIVAESAVVTVPHEIKGQAIAAFCVLRPSVEASDVPSKVRDTVREVLSPIAVPDKIWIVPGLPKTRSGKIMRRVLRKIGDGEYGAIGDISTLAEPGIVDDIVRVVRGSRP